MKEFTFLILLVLFFTNCKNNNDPKPLPEVAGIAGKWRLTEQTYLSGDSTITVDILSSAQKDIFIRYDGVMLIDGYAACCVPKKYLINGKLFNVVPKEEILVYAICDCVGCDELVISQTGDTMITTFCNGGTSTYRRVK